MKVINLAIIGLGKIAHKFASDVPLVKGVLLYGVASRDVGKAREFAAKHNAQEVFESYKALIDDQRVDLVYIATPNNFHFEHTMMCLDAGKAVICEKPFALNSSQVTQMIAKAAQKRLFLMEALWTRFIPATQKVIDLIAQGKIGEITAIKADFGFEAAVDYDSRLYSKSLGGGSLLDIGIYPIYLSYLLLGMPDSIKATATLSLTGVDSDCDMIFKYGNALSNLQCSFTQNTPTEALILGTKGIIKMNSRFHHCKSLTVITEYHDPITITIDYKGNGYSHELAHVVDCMQVQAIESDLVTHKASQEVIKLIDQVRSKIGLIYAADSSK